MKKLYIVFLLIFQQLQYSVVFCENQPQKNSPSQSSKNPNQAQNFFKKHTKKLIASAFLIFGCTALLIFNRTKEKENDQLQNEQSKEKENTQIQNDQFLRDDENEIKKFIEGIVKTGIPNEGEIKNYTFQGHFKTCTVTIGCKENDETKDLVYELMKKTNSIYDDNDVKHGGSLDSSFPKLSRDALVAMLNTIHP
jgi:hypothetical protein